MIKLELISKGQTFLSEKGEDGFIYTIETFWSPAAEEIVIGRRVEEQMFQKLMEDGKWENDSETTVPELFESLEEAFGHLNNIVSDAIAIGTPVLVSTGPDRDNQEWEGVVVVNDRYNEDYPYKVKIDDGDKTSYGVFSSE